MEFSLKLFQLVFLIALSALTFYRTEGAPEIKHDSNSSFLPQNLVLQSPTNLTVWTVSGRRRNIRWTYDGSYFPYWDIEIHSREGQPVYITRGMTGLDVKVINRTEHQLNKSEYRYEIIVPDYVKTGKYLLVLKGISENVEDNVVTKLFRSSLFQILGSEETKDNYPQVKYLKERYRKLMDQYRGIRDNQLFPHPSDHCTIHKLENPSLQSFRHECENKQACVLSGLAGDWPAMRTWEFDTLSTDKRLEKGVRVGGQENKTAMGRWNQWRKDRAARYHEIQPMIFMQDMFEEYPSLLKDYTVPEVVSQDKDIMMELPEDTRLFHAAGPATENALSPYTVRVRGMLVKVPLLEERRGRSRTYSSIISERLDWRWMILAARRSGSSWHVDPANTTAWLALAHGQKRWGVYPKGRYFVPGVKNNVYKYRDYSMIDAFNWWVYTYPYLKQDHKPLECVQKKGDMVYLPSGTWHAVLNLRDTVAVTQNLVDTTSLRSTLQEIRELSDCTSAKQLRLSSIQEELRALYYSKYPGSFAQEDIDFESPENELSADEYKEKEADMLEQLLTREDTEL